MVIALVLTGSVVTNSHFLSTMRMKFDGVQVFHLRFVSLSSLRSLGATGLQLDM